MLTDAALKNLLARSNPYKSTDRDDMYAYVSPGGAISFRYDAYSPCSEAASAADTTS